MMTYRTIIIGQVQQHALHGTLIRQTLVGEPEQYYFKIYHNIKNAYIVPWI